MQQTSRCLFLLACAFLAACTDPAAPEPEAASEPAPDLLHVVAINAPLAFFAERLGADLVVVDLLVQGSADPADWQPEATDVVAMQGADLILLNGAGYEPWLERVSLPESRVLISSEAVAAALIESETITHRHGPEGDHSHTETASTLWMDPLLALEQARSVAAALSGLRPEAADEISARMAALEHELLQLHQAWLQVAARAGAAPLLFSHPVYQYFERRYQLNGRSLHWEPAEDPGESEWSALAVLLETHPARLMVWEGEPASETIRRLSDLGVGTLVVKPGADAASGDFLDVQNANVDRFSVALGNGQ